MYPKTIRAATSLAQRIQDLAYAIVPRLEVAVIADVQNYTKYGYVLASANRGSIQVFGVPASDALRGNRIYVQNAGPERNQRYVWQATAVACMTGLAAGSIVFQNPVPLNTTFNPAHHNYPVMPGTTKPTWTIYPFESNYIEFFFWAPSLPSADCVLFELGGPAGSGVFANYYTIKCKYRTDGTIGLYCIQNYSNIIGELGLGSIQSVQTLAAGTVHYVVWQFQDGDPNSWSLPPLIVDGYSTAANNGQNIWTATGNFALSFMHDLGSGIANLTFLNAFCNAQTPPVGTWLSKFGIGVSQNSGVAQVPITGVPTSDSQIPNGDSALNHGLTTFDLWLNQYTTNSAIGTGPGMTGLALPDSGALAQNLTLDTYYIAGQAIGPYTQ